MSGFGVFRTDIAQTDNQIFHLALSFGALFRSLGAARSTGYADCANRLRRRGYELQVIEFEVADEDCLTDVERSYVHYQLVRQILDECADNEFAGRQSQFAADFHTLGSTRKTNRNGNRNRLALLHAVEVDMENLLAYRMILYVAQNGFLDFAVDVEFDDVGVRSVDERFDGFRVDCESDVLAAAIDYARNQTLAAAALAAFLPYSARAAAFSWMVFIMF